MSQSDDLPGRRPIHDVVSAALDEPRDAGAHFIWRTGIAKITSANGSVYSITEQRRDPDSGLWSDAVEPLGYVTASAFEFRDRSTGQVDSLVRFWEQRQLGGELELLIDLATDFDERVKVSQNDTTERYLVQKLVGDDGTGDNLKVTLVEQNDGGDETLKIQIAREDIASGGLEKAVCHRISIPDGSSSGTTTIDSGDWRGRVLCCWLQAVYSNSPSTAQWGGGATSGVTRYFGSGYSGSDKTLVSGSGGTPAVKLTGSGSLIWGWAANSTGNDCHAVCLVQATGTKTEIDHTV